MTALPHAFYPESSWRDDMQLGAAEIALAAHALGEPAKGYLRDGAHWARGFIAHHGTDTLNLYDTSALADSSLVDAMDLIPHGRLAVDASDLVDHLRGQIERGRRHARQDAFGGAEPVSEFDANSHTFGLIASVALYDRLMHTRKFRGFAGLERTWLLGGDAWGVTAMVGIGHHFPLCMQHQVANLSGTLDGTAADRCRRGRQRAQRQGQLRGRSRRVPGRHAALHRRRSPPRPVRRPGRPVRRRRPRLADR